MAENRGRVLGQLPVRYAASGAGLFIPAVSEPPGATAVFGIPDGKGLAAVGGDGGQASPALNGFHAVQHPGTRGP